MLVTLLLLGAWLVVVVAMGVLGAMAGQSGADRVRGVELSAGVREFLDGEFDDDLEAARADFERADRLLDNPIVAPARFLPVAGRQLRSAGALASTSADVLDASARAAAALRNELDDGTPAGSDRVGAIDRLRGELRDLHDVLMDADLGPSMALVGPLQDARLEFDDKLTDARGRTEDLVVVLDAMHALLEGPSRYLVLAANNAEMRIGSGMFLSVGELQIADGRLSVAEDFEPSGDVALAERLPLTDEMAQLWGWSGTGIDLRSLGLSARFPVNAELASTHWTALGRGEVDGAMAVDVVALRSLLGVVGPVQLDDLTIDADNVLDFLLREQYRDADDDDANAERRERLGDLASVVLEKLGSDTVDLPGLVDALQEARDGRHLLLWSEHAEQQRAWRQLGVDGDLDDESVLVGLANVDASKLDPFLEMSVEVEGSPQGDDVRYSLTISIRNTAPGGMNSYIEGSDGSPDYRGLLSAHLPTAARDVTIEGFDGISAAGPDGPTVVIAAPVAVEQGGERIGELHFTLPADQVPSVLPSARLPAVRWTLGDRTVPDDSGVELRLHDR